jgi:DNA repair protein RadC
VVFANNQPSGVRALPEDVDLTGRLRAAADLVEVLAREHFVVAAGGYYSFVGAGRWKR